MSQEHFKNTKKTIFTGVEFYYVSALSDLHFRGTVDPTPHLLTPSSMFITFVYLSPPPPTLTQPMFPVSELSLCGRQLPFFLPCVRAQPVKPSPPPPNISHPNQWEPHEYFTLPRQAPGKQEKEVCLDGLGGGGWWGGWRGLGCQESSAV